MIYVLDANILLRQAEPSSQHHSTVIGSLRRLTGQGHSFAIFPQALFEFWSVASRPLTANGLGYSPAILSQWITGFRAQYLVHYDNAAVVAEWERIVLQYGTLGKNSHDARYVAAMRAHGLSHLLTLNGKDLVRYVNGERIVLVDPASL
jgi:predicted nucleic acid-binding protein